MMSSSVSIYSDLRFILESLRGKFIENTRHSFTGRTYSSVNRLAACVLLMQTFVAVKNFLLTYKNVFTA